VAKDTNSFSNQVKRVGSKLSSLAAPAKAAVQRGAAERKTRTTPKPAPEKSMRVMGKTKAETSANLDAAKAKRSSAPMAPLRKDAVPASATKNVGTAKAGAFPVYKKDSAQASSFRDEFAKAKAGGKKVFTWNGRSYNTKTK